MSNNSKSVKKFTGYHATIIIVAFFAVVVGVNMVMARFALSTFGGTVVDNSYVASQKYNDWLAQAREQKSHGWAISKITRDQGSAILKLTQVDGSALSGALVTAAAQHPVGRADTIEISFTETAAGTYKSREILPEGRWKLRLTVEQDDKVMRVARDIR